jgi:hypothetical protein
MIVKNQHTSNMQIDNQSVREKLKQTLTEIADFAFKQNLQYWGEHFDKAKAILDSASREDNYCHQDLIPHEYN